MAHRREDRLGSALAKHLAQEHFASWTVCNFSEEHWGVLIPTVGTFVSESALKEPYLLALRLDLGGFFGRGRPRLPDE